MESTERPTFTGAAAASGRRPAKDAVLEGAVELAKSALLETVDSAGDVGEYLGFVVEAERLGVHWFAATMPGYRGWRWYVSLSRAPRSRTATICESGLLPGDGSLLAPEWVPWSERLAPGDLSSTDRLPLAPDDPRLETGYLVTGDPEQDRLAIVELGLGRDRVMNARAIDAAATRWYAGSQGPDNSGTRAADQPCASCGFVIPLAGSLGHLFGVCANEWSPDDGSVVSLNHGCGAHSETDVVPQGHEWTQSDLVLDEQQVDIVTSAPAAVVDVEAATDARAEPVPESDASATPESTSHATGSPDTSD